MAITQNRNLFAFLSINNKRYPLFNGHNFIGRNKKADVILKDISTSQQHAVITILHNKIYISDLKSSNSTYIQTTAIIPLQLYEITDQCELTFGTVKATLIINSKDAANNGLFVASSQIDDAVFGLPTQLQSDLSLQSIKVHEKTDNQIDLLVTDKLALGNSKNQSELIKSPKKTGITVTNNIENVVSDEVIVEVDYDTDLDSTSPEITAKIKASVETIGLDSDTDFDEANKLKFASGIKITEISDSDSVESLEFDLNNSSFNEYAAESHENKQAKTVGTKSNTQDSSNNIIASSDDTDSETENHAIVKIYKNNKIHENKFDSATNVNDSLNNEENDSNGNEDITQYIKNKILDNTRGINYDDLSFIPATQDIGENVEVSSSIVEIENLQPQDRVSQASFHLGISEYMSHDELGSCRLIANVENTLNRDDQNKIAFQSGICSNNEVNKGDEKVILATTQQIESTVKSNDVGVNVEVEDAVFLEPTQQINCCNDCDITDQVDDNSVFGRATQKLPRNGADQSHDEIENDNLMTQQQINTNHKNIVENSLCIDTTHNNDENEEIIEDNLDYSLLVESTDKLQLPKQTNVNNNSVPAMYKQVNRAEDNSRCSIKSSEALIVESSKRIEVPPEDLTVIAQPDRVDTKVVHDLFCVSTKKSVDAANIEEIKSNTDLFDLPTQVVSCKINTIKQSEYKNAQSDLFGVPTQIISDIPSKVALITQKGYNEEKSVGTRNINETNTDLFDLSAQILLHPQECNESSIVSTCTNINEKLDVENTNLFDLPTQVVSYKINTIKKSDSKNAQSDLFDVPTQIISDVPSKVALVTQKGYNEEKSVGTRNINETNTDLFDLPAQILLHPQECNKSSIASTCTNINEKLDRGNTNLFDLPTQVVSYKINTIKKSDSKNAQSDLFDVPTQIISDIPSKVALVTQKGHNEEKSVGTRKINETNTDLFDLPAQILLHPQECNESSIASTCTNINEKLDRGNTNLFDLPTQVVSYKINTIKKSDSKNAQSDLFDVPTQIISDVPSKVALVTQKGYNEEKSVGIRKINETNTDLFDLPAQILLRPQECNKNVDSKNYNESASISTENKMLDERVGANSIEITKVMTTENKNNSLKVKKFTTRGSKLKVNDCIELKLEINNTKQLSEGSNVGESIEKDIILPRRVTRKKFKKTANQKDTEKLLKDYGQINIEIVKGFKKLEENTGIEDDITKIRRSIANMKDNLNEKVEKTCKSDNDCTQEVLHVLTSDSHIKNVQSENSIKPMMMQTSSSKMTQSSKKGGKGEAMHSTQEVLDILTSDSPAKCNDNNYLNALIFIKPKDIKKNNRKNEQERNRNISQRDLRQVKRNINATKSIVNYKLEIGDVPMCSTQDVVDVLTATDDNVRTEKNLTHLNETHDSLSESIFIKRTKDLHINLQSTMINNDDTVNNNDGIPSDDDFEDTKIKSDVPLCNTKKIKDSLDIQSASAASKVKPKSKKRVKIKDSELDVIYEIPAQVISSSVNCKKTKFTQKIQDGKNDVKDLEMPRQMTSKVDESKSNSKIRSCKEKVITGILKKTTKVPKSTKATKLDTITTASADNKACKEENILTDAVVVRKSRSRKASNNNDVEVNTMHTEDVSKLKKRGRPKKNVDVKTCDSSAVPMLKRIASKRSISNIESDADPGTSKQSSEDENRLIGKKGKSEPLLNESSPAKRFRTDSTISDSQTSLSQRPKRPLKPKVVFTMLNSPELESIIRYLGGTVVDSVEVSTVLVTASVKRTEKLLTAIGLGKPICSDMWLKECKLHNKFLDPWCHIFRDLEAETKWDFSLEDSLERSRKKKLFENYTMMLIVNSAQDILKKAIESTGGKCVSNVRKTRENFVIVSVVENQNKFQKYIKDKSDLIVIEPEAIFDAVLRQEIRFNMFKLV